MEHSSKRMSLFRRDVLVRGWKQSPATFCLIVVNVFWYVVIETIHGTSTYGLLQSGAMAGVLVQHGQWYRLVSSMFVHLSILHLLLNMVSLWSLFIVEIAFGTRAFVVMYVASGIVGNLISFTFMSPYVVSAGASGAIFGVFGAIITLAFMGVLPRVARNQLVLLLAANILFDISRPNIDLLAHLGGLAVGVLFTLLYKKFRPGKKTWAWLYWPSVVIVVAALFRVLI